MKARGEARRAARRAAAKLDDGARERQGVVVCTACGSVQQSSEEGVGCFLCGAWPLLAAQSSLFSQAIAMPGCADFERDARTSLGSKIGAVVMVAGVMGVGGAFLYFLATSGGKGYQVAPVLALMVLVLFGVPSMVVLGRNLRAAFDDGPPALPNPSPWVPALPGSGAVAGASGLITTDAPLQAPFTKRSCAAYEVAIRPRGTTGHEAWIHMVSHSAALRVGRVGADANTLRVSTGRQPIIVDDASTPMLERYFVSVGLQDDVDRWEVFESIAPVRARATLTVDEDGEATLHV